MRSASALARPKENMKMGYRKDHSTGLQLQELSEKMKGEPLARKSVGLLALQLMEIQARLLASMKVHLMETMLADNWKKYRKD